MADLQGRVGFITGGGTGIGLACAREIVAGGGSVVLGGRREEVVTRSAAELGSRALGVVCDVTDDASVEKAVQATVDAFGGLNLAVNCAGIGSIGSVLNSTAEEFARIQATNLTGVFRSMRAEALAMRRSRSESGPDGPTASIVNISSIAATRTHRWMSAYCTSKAGLNMLTQCSADDLGEHGIRVNAVGPSLVPTDISAGLVNAEPAVEEYLRRIPAGRIGTTEDVASMVAFLLSDAASWITGQCIGIDGGHDVRQGPDLVPLFRDLLPDER